MCVSFFIGDEMNELFMKEAYKEALKAFKENEVPIGCVIVKDNKIIAKGHNQKEKYNCVTKHAEIIAIEKACKKLKTWHLNGCSIYVTVEPCLMCVGAIIQSHICSIFYSIENEKFGAVKSKYSFINLNKIKVYTGILAEPVHEIMKKFFIDKR